ncbi:TetR/AcrR family transcriptional regulator [Arvimicrobium flavum]|uniref:TetR/AcrR family transcriptional regulator n=1 Tax=Arvimicrobium flavum TaxID=3393320 RepID=UPI00237B037C|nr:TetR/AcrR family transcriptional regulator [Mesorhizobium shangrilense]
MSQTIQDRRERQKAAQRDELLKAAHQLVQEDGYEGLTIRKLATRAGYAPMSVYSYFADKHAILVALAEDHFALLARRLNRDFSVDPVDALREGLLEYVDFALESPNEYRTIFMSTEIDKDAEEFAEKEAGNPALRILIDRVDAAVAAGRLRGDTHAIATMLWTVAHGAISLLIAFPHYPFGEPRQYAERVIAIALLGLSAAEVEPLVDTLPHC